MTERDYLTLFSYFAGARGDHSVHVRALVHAGFTVEADADIPMKSYVINPESDKRIGTIIGESGAMISWIQSAKPAKPAGRISTGSGV